MVPSPSLRARAPTPSSRLHARTLRADAVQRLQPEGPRRPAQALARAARRATGSGPGPAPSDPGRGASTRRSCCSAQQRHGEARRHAVTRHPVRRRGHTSADDDVAARRGARRRARPPGEGGGVRRRRPHRTVAPPVGAPRLRARRSMWRRMRVGPSRGPFPWPRQGPFSVGAGTVGRGSDRRHRDGQGAGAAVDPVPPAGGGAGPGSRVPVPAVRVSRAAASARLSHGVRDSESESATPGGRPSARWRRPQSLLDAPAAGGFARAP